MQEFNLNNAQMDMDMGGKSISLFDFQKVKMMLALHWQWFILSIIACLIVAKIYLWTTPTTLSVTGKMRLIERSSDKNSASSAGMAILSSLPLGLGSSLSSSLGGSMGIDIEKEVLRSNDLVRDVVLDLGLYTEYRMGKWGRTSLMYKDQPVEVTLDKTHLHWMDRELPLSYHQIKLTIRKNADGYQVEAAADGKAVPVKTFKKLPASIRTECGTVMLSENKSLTVQQQQAYAKGFEMEAKIAPPMIVANGFISRLVVEPPKKNVSNILHLTLRDENMIRGIDFINRLVETYNRRSKEEVEDQNRKTDEFVNERLAKLNKELGTSDDAYEGSKVKYQITDAAADAGEALGKKSQYEEQLIQIGIQLQLQDYMNEFAQDPAKIYEVIPVVSGGSTGYSSNMGGSMSAGGGQALSRHNTLAFQRKELLKSMSDKAPQVQRVTELIEELRPTLLTELSRTRQALVIQRQNMEREYNKAMQRIGSAPHVERVFTDIERLREIKQGVYVVMLQKREELAMNRIEATNKGKLIEKVQVNGGSTLPKDNMIYVIAIVIGALLPLGVLIVLMFMKSKVETRSDLDAATRYPVLGDVPNVNNEEALRTVRTSLLLHLKEGQKTILVTSNAMGEGKTYNAIRLAEGLAVLDKKVALCDLNLRRPAVAQALSISGKTGLAGLLNGTPAVADVQSQMVKVNGVDVLVAGSSTQQHPSDLLARDSFAQILAILKADYDYVILDAPAIAGSSDTLQIATQADATCFVVKADHTPKSAIKSLDKNQQLPDIMMIFNAIDMTKKKYKFLYKQALALFSVGLFLSSCSVKNFAYFQGAHKIDLNKQSALYDARIMPKDQLDIHVYTISPEASAPFNMGSVSVSSANMGGSAASSTGSQNYLVSNDGTINFPVLGRIKVTGLTKDECEDMILEKIRPYMAASEKPIVTVRQANYTITVLGEVGSPGSIQVTREKINIYEALAMAGDMTVTGKRVNVKLFRENADGKRELHILDLSDADIINSPYFYLQQNDMIYVEPSIVKKQQGNILTSFIIPLVSSLVSFSALLIAITK